MYLQHVLDAELVRGPVLEVGSYPWQGEQGNTRHLVAEYGLEWAGTDIKAGPDVDFTLDLLDEQATAAVGRTWQSVLVFNLLEHVYDPGLALRNALQLVAPGGSLVVVGPAFWELHDFPQDLWRPLPDFYVEFARRNDCSVADDAFKWIRGETLLDVEALRVHDAPAQKYVPSRVHGRQTYGRPRYFWSRGIHLLFRTMGHDLWFPRLGLGVTLVRAGSASATG